MVSGPTLFPDAGVRTIAEGVVHFAAALDDGCQRRLAGQCVDLLDGPVPGYVPVVRGGGHMHVRMLCLGRHWNGRAYRYERVRADHDGLEPPPVPPSWRELASAFAERAGMPMCPDICILNHYDEDGRMGLHQDKDETATSLRAGAPIVSISLGDSGRFLLGGIRRRDPVQPVRLDSGDVLVFGGPSRLRYHGLARVLPGTAPVGFPCSGRLNLTFRQY